jgi:hypothetical protein
MHIGKLQAPSAWTYTVRTLTGGIFRMYIPFALVNAESG